MSPDPTQGPEGRRPSRGDRSLITVFSDASFSAETGAAGWGAWARRPDWSQGALFGGPIPVRLKDSGEAELCGIASAILHLESQGMLRGMEAAILQCDNLRAVGLVAGRIAGARVSNHEQAADVIPLSGSPMSAAEASAIAEIAARTKGIRIFVRHVRGHKAGGKRQWVNRQCDRMAKDGRLEAERSLAARPR